MRGKKLISTTLGVLIGFLVLLAASRISIKCLYNRINYENFTKKANPTSLNNPYTQKMPLHDIEIDEIYHMFRYWGVMPVKVTYGELEIPFDIAYYNNNQEKAYTIHKGTKVHRMSTYEESIGYGFQSLPTYDKKWRYAIPFKSVDKEANDPDYQNFYYIPTDTLVKLFRSTMESAEEDYVGKIQKRLLGCDLYLEFEGMYYSPNLYLDVLSLLDVFLLLVIGIAGFCLHKIHNLR